MTDYEPYVSLEPVDPPDRAVRSILPQTPDSDTRWVWMISLMPLAPALILVAAVALRVPLTWLLVAALIAASCLATLVFAGRDRSALESRGFTRLPPRLLALVPIVWLFQRAKRVWLTSYRGFGPVWANLGSGILATLIFYFGLPLGIALKQSELWWLNFA